MFSRLMSLTACSAMFVASSLTVVKTASAASPCPGFNPSQFVHATTKNFDVYICGADTPHEYVSVSKKNGKKFILPLRKNPDNVNNYVAINGAYCYVLSPNYLKVTKSGKVIVNEKAKWISG
jgi:hypothetical protein